MKKCIILVTLLLVAVMMFSACAGVVDAGKFYKNYEYEAAKVLASATEKEGLQDKAVTDTRNYLVTMTKAGTDDQTVSVYNLRADKEVWTKTYKAPMTVAVSYISVFGEDLIVVNVAENVAKEGDPADWEYTTTVYDDEGTKVAEADKTIDASAIRTSYDLFQFDNGIYRVTAEGVVTVKEASPFNMTLPSFDFYNGEFYITYDYDNDYEPTQGIYWGEAEATVYDADLTMLVDWVPGSSLFSTVSFSMYLGVLNDGTIIYQYTEALNDLETEYDFVDNAGKKYDIITMLIDPETGKEKDIDVDYMLLDVWTMDTYYSNGKLAREEDGVHDAYDNVGVIYYIEDGKLYMGNESERYVALNNKGKIKGELFSDLPNIGAGMLNPVADGMFYYVDTNGTYVLINEDGDKVAEVANWDSRSQNMRRNENFYLYDGVIYDKTFTKVYDYEADDYTFKAILDYGVLFEKEGALYIYENATDGMTKVYGKDDNKTYVAGNMDYYAVRDGAASEDAYTYYNAKGVKLFSSDSAAQLVMYDSEEGIALFAYLNKDAKTVYVRVGA